jgi:hypothetical protein
MRTSWRSSAERDENDTKTAGKTCNRTALLVPRDGPHAHEERALQRPGLEAGGEGDEMTQTTAKRRQVETALALRMFRKIHGTRKMRAKRAAKFDLFAFDERLWQMCQSDTLQEVPDDR